MNLKNLETRLPWLEPHDIFLAALCLFFAAFSLIWPSTGYIPLAGFSLARGYVVFPIFSALALLILSLGRFDPALMSRPFTFIRTFYPQALFGPLLHRISPPLRSLQQGRIL